MLISAGIMRRPLPCLYERPIRFGFLHMIVLLRFQLFIRVLSNLREQGVEIAQANAGWMLDHSIGYYEDDHYKLAQLFWMMAADQVCSVLLFPRMFSSCVLRLVARAIPTRNACWATTITMVGSGLLITKRRPDATNSPQTGGTLSRSSTSGMPRLFRAAKVLC